ncbi:oxidoreductase, FAD-binding [Oceanicola granulosus HTCC2516]|uniref:Oxidoreductase, FAD-binding n=1 Tax=Oceanicola granulosus (strain ATCC BAA-861 / DSM 15982 / KCTC 12143 / HTCC2516) TaxID=314256 RepID=Q2CI14_OCEGH|nr:oxidoreductase, FAD-binding [Oceanicola granulosus HTCC2516]
MHIAIIGAGVIGITTALALAGRGHRVTVLDREGIAAGASQGNAGGFAFSEVIPLATPRIMTQAPKWLADPDGPLSIPPGYLLPIAPWLVRFWRASRPDRYRAAVTAQAALMALSRRELEALVAAQGLEGLLRRQGQLSVYRSEAAFDAAGPAREEARAAGVTLDVLRGAGALAEVQPGLAPDFVHGTFTPDWINVVDPKAWVEALAERLRARGGAIREAEAKAVRCEGEGVVVETRAGPVAADRAVVACGAWSLPVIEGLGLRPPLETERGYNTTLPSGAFDLRTQVTFAEHGFVASRIGEGVRIGGAVELGGLTRPPRMARAEAMLRKARRFLPGCAPRADGSGWASARRCRTRCP